MCHGVKEAVGKSRGTRLTPTTQTASNNYYATCTGYNGTESELPTCTGYNGYNGTMGLRVNCLLAYSRTLLMRRYESWSHR